MRLFYTEGCTSYYTPEQYIHTCIFAACCVLIHSRHNIFFRGYSLFQKGQLMWSFVSRTISKMARAVNIYLRNQTILQYIPRNMHTVFALLCFVVVIHWLIFPYPPGLLRWHCGNLTIAPVPAKQPWWIWINTSCEFIMNDCITTTKQSTTKPCAYFLGYTVLLNKYHHFVKHWCYRNRSGFQFNGGASKSSSHDGFIPRFVVH